MKQFEPYTKVKVTPDWSVLIADTGEPYYDENVCYGVVIDTTVKWADSEERQVRLTNGLEIVVWVECLEEIEYALNYPSAYKKGLFE